MHILYDGTPLLMRSAGVKNYHYNLLKHLIPNIAPHRISLFPFLKTLALNKNESSNYPPFSTAWRLGAVLSSNYLGWPMAPLAAANADLFHVTPHVWKVPKDKCLTAMVHDPTPILLPDCHTRSNIRYFQHFVHNTLHKLHRVLVPSHAVKADLIEEFNVPEKKISVVYHGIEEGFFETTAAAQYLVRQKYRLPDRYILFVGTQEPRKNLIRLARAYDSMPEPLKKEYPLVIVGSPGWKDTAIQKVLAATPNVILVGRVRGALLPSIYHGASLFVFPTLYEGFGFPLLEAMAARVPIVTSKSGAAAEVVGDGGLLVDPLNITEIATAMERILDNTAMANALGGAGRQRARAFTWEKTVLQTKAFFEKALGAETAAARR